MRRLLASVASAALLAGVLAAPAASQPSGDEAPAEPAVTTPQDDAARGRRAAPMPSFQADGDNLVRLMVGAFDPLRDQAPVAAGFARVDRAQLPGGEAAYWLVQVAERDFASATAAIDDAGGVISGFVNDAAYIVRATPQQLAVISGAAAVRAAVPYQPGWKVPQKLGEYEALMDLEGQQTYRLYVFRAEAGPVAVRDAVAAIDGVNVVETDGRVIDLTATAQQLPAIAAVGGVEWIETKPTLAPLNMNARWVNDTGVRDVQHVITESRLTGEGQTAAVADTGVNYLPDFNSGAQSYFRDCPEDTADEGLVSCKVADYTQAQGGNTAVAMNTISDNKATNGGRHRKMAAYFDVGNSKGISATASNHGTHVSGSVTGDTKPYGQWNRADGLAPRARLVHQSIETASGGLSSPAGDLLWRQAYRPRDPNSVPATYDAEDAYADYRPDEDARTHNNSYGLIVPNVSLGSAEAADRFVWEHEDMFIVSSAGNSGPGPYQIGAPSIGKNVITSGASANGRQPMVSIDSMASFSSHGPTPDGRLGVDLSTPGQIVVSAKGGTDDEEHYLQGTSMSGPLLTGLATLVRQYFWDGYGAVAAPADGVPMRADGLAVGTRAKDTRSTNPSAALVRATMVNGAERMRGFYTGDDGANRSLDGQYPSAGQGFGQVNLDRSLYFSGDADDERRSRRATWFKDVWRGDGAAADANSQPFTEGAGETRTHQIDVAEGAPLSVTLAFTDAPSSPAQGTVARVNNLDLTVTAPDGTLYAGNNFNTRLQATDGEYQTLPDAPNYDANNPVERVRIPQPQPGIWTIEVRGTAVARGPQGFALAANGHLSRVEADGEAPDAFNPGPPLQVDAAGAPTISGLRVESVSADLAKVTWSTSEPTTGAVTTTVNGAEKTYPDVYNHDRPGATRTDGDQGYNGITEAPVESSDQYSNKPVVSDRHEVLVTGLSAGQSYQLNITSTDLADPPNTATQTTQMRSTKAIYGAQPFDMANLVAAPEDPAFDPILGIGDGAYGTSTQLYAGQSGGGLLGAVMFRVPTSVDPAAIRGAAVEFSSAHDVTNHYTDDVRYYVDLMPEAMEENWQSQNYGTVHSAPPEARTVPQTGYRRGANKVYPFSFGCGEIESLRASLSRVSSTGDRRAAFRFDALTSNATSLFSMEYGFNRRSKGAELRPRLVLYLDENRDGSVADPRHCDPVAPAPTIDDVGVQQALRDNSMTVSWRTDQPSDSTVLFRPKGSNAEFTQVHVPSLTTAHQVQLLGLQPDTEYEFGVRSSTCNGNTTTDDNEDSLYRLKLPAQPIPDEENDNLDLYYLKGVQNDQANKAAGTPSATFGPEGPDEATPIQQLATQFAADTPENPYSAYWTGPFQGSLDGKDLTFTWWWSSTNATAVAIGAEIEVKVYADVDTPTEALLARQVTRVAVGPGPTRNVNVVPVEGSANESLTIQVKTVYIDTGNDIRANYDAPSAPSRFTVPKVAPPPAPTPGEGSGLARQAGPIPPESAGSTVNLADVPTRQSPSSSDVSAGTAHCAPFQVASADQPTNTGGGGSTGPGASPTPTPSGSPSPTPSGTPTPTPTPAVAPTPGPEGEPQPGDGPVDACDPEFVPTGTFDDISRSVHRDNINCIAWYLITLGTSNTRATGRSYAPYERVTRAQMASFIARLAVEGGIELPASPRNHFRDDNGDVHERNINALAELGLVKGISAGRYAPGRRVTRAQMATFIANVHRMAVGTAPRPSRDYYNDDNGNTHERNINTLAELGVVVGTRRGVYSPAARVSREQMATFIANDLRLFVDADKAFPGGAEVLLTPRADDQRTVEGEVRSRRRLTRLVANGCGLQNTSVAVADDGTFRITIPPTQAAGECELRLTAHTKGVRTVDEQEVTYTFTVVVKAQPQPQPS